MVYAQQLKKCFHTSPYYLTITVSHQSHKLEKEEKLFSPQET
ncbi:hypothetical protein BSM4216_2284 [Bacillus smithii]|nr:hypothetical protein BSM4216_2284 [Bacillus smithii]